MISHLARKPTVACTTVGHSLEFIDRRARLSDADAASQSARRYPPARASLRRRVPPLRASLALRRLARRLALAKAVDTLDAKYGRHTVYPASMHDARTSGKGGIAFQSVPDLTLPDALDDPDATNDEDGGELPARPIGPPTGTPSRPRRS